MPLNEKLLLSVNEASKLSGLQPAILRLQIQKGRLDYMVTGKMRKVLINRKSLEYLIDEMSRCHEEIEPASARQEYAELRARKKARA